MMISTKGRYALRFLVDLAEHLDDGFVPLKEVSMRQEISEKYLEIVVKELVKGGLQASAVLCRMMWCLQMKTGHLLIWRCIIFMDTIWQKQLMKGGRNFPESVPL